MDDLISRQAAIDAAQEWFDGLIVGSFNGLKKKLEAVPSAQPEIIRCKDCKHWTIHKRLELPWCRAMHIDRGANCFCSYAERKTDDTR